MISEFVTEVSTTPDSLGEASDRLAKEIESLGELAAAKEMEWNAILRVRIVYRTILYNPYVVFLTWCANAPYRAEHALYFN